MGDRLAEKNRLDADSFAPAYFQLAQILHERIMSGELRPGDRIPSESELTKRYGLSRMTVRRSIAALSEKGLLRSEQGRGTFVVNPRMEGGVFVIPDFHEEMRNQGMSSNARLLKVKVVSAGKRQAEKMDIRKGKRVIYLERVLEGDGEPLIFDRKYILFDQSQPLLEAELGYGSTEDLFAGNPDMVPVRADLTLSATVLKAREAELLKSKTGAPAFCMEQVIYAANDRRVIWGWLIFRGDKFHFNALSRMF
jgi:GntR family transcriptional regulator